MKRSVIFAGGGTGGHVFPLVAVAQALVQLDPELTPVFVGTARGMETRFVPEQGFPLELLRVLPIRGGGVWGALKGSLRAAQLLPESRALLKRYDPVGVFSVGGYAAGPVSLAARTMGIPLALLEPNSVIGLANWLISPLVQRAYTAFEQTDRNFSEKVVRRLGVPLRAGFSPVAFQPEAGALRILVLGGSQGAKILNETLPRVLSKLRAPVRVIHQCGRAHLEDVSARYRDAGGDSAEVTAFIEDMPAALAQADLVVSRSGAGAVSEILAVGRPSLLIPYPFASGDHQRLNAEALQIAGAARIVLHRECTEARLQKELEALTSDREALQRMAETARMMGRPHAALEVARDFLALIEARSTGDRALPRAPVARLESSTKEEVE